MKRENEISGFVQLGKLMSALGNEEIWTNYSIGATEIEYQKLQGIIGKQFVLNGWFSKENVLQSLLSLGNQLTENNLNNWLKDYTYSISPKRIGIIMAGNIPLVGFHDFLCVLLSGNSVVAKLSSDDNTLLPALAEQLIQYTPSLKERINFSFGKLGEIEAIIATGSNNSTKYFEQYFGHYPHLFRKNRTSIAILTGEETKEELTALGKDIFSYFGLGCRNVSHLLIPKDFNLNRFFEAIVDYHPIVNHHKYANNYDYNKAVFLMSNFKLLDNEFLTLKEDSSHASPISSVFYERYENLEEIQSRLQHEEDQIQCIVSNNLIENSIAFGQTQQPKLWHYADNVDTIKFLLKI